MPTHPELLALSVSERLLLVEELWDSIAADQHSLPDHPSIAETLRERKAEYRAHPSSGVSWGRTKEHFH